MDDHRQRPHTERDGGQDDGSDGQVFPPAQVVDRVQVAGHRKPGIVVQKITEHPRHDDGCKERGDTHPDASQYRDGPVEHRIAPQSGQDADKNADDHGQGHGHYGQYYGIGERLSDDTAHVQAVALVRLAQVRELW